MRLCRCPTAETCRSLPSGQAWREKLLGGAAQVYAIIATGGKQYRVSEGDNIYVEKLSNEQGEPLQAGDVVTFPVMMVSGETIAVGNPYITGATVTGKIVRQLRGEKIHILKYKSKKNYRRKAGHRQPYTQVEITGING